MEVWQSFKSTLRIFAAKRYLPFFEEKKILPKKLQKLVVTPLPPCNYDPQKNHQKGLKMVFCLSNGFTNGPKKGCK